MHVFIHRGRKLCGSNKGLCILCAWFRLRTFFIFQKYVHEVKFKMKNRIQGLIAGILIGATVAGSATAVTAAKLAKVKYENIEIAYNGLELFKDNIPIKLTDANGKTVEPFIYNNSTYVPLESLVGLTDFTTTWDGANNRIYIWDEIVPGNAYLLDVCPPYSYTDSYTVATCKIYNPADTKTFSMGGTEYNNGLTFCGYYDDEVDALFNLGGKYKSMTMLVGPEDTTSRKKYNPSDLAFFVDGKLVAKCEVNDGDFPKEVTIPLNYGKQLKIAVVATDKSHATTCLANITVE